MATSTSTSTTMYNGGGLVNATTSSSSSTSGIPSLRTHLQSRHVSNTSSPVPNSNGSNASRSSAPSPSASPTRPKFDGPLLKAYMKKLLASTLGSSVWPDVKDKDRVRMWCHELGERVKERAVEIEPRGFKYMVTTLINENLGQGGRADLVCHWEDSDTVIQEVYANDSLICVCIVFAVRTV